MALTTTNQPTPYQAVNLIVNDYLDQLTKLLGKQIVGVYLYGSLTYNDFHSQSSDIDLMIIVQTPLNTDQINDLKKLHQDLENQHPTWQNRIEASYTPVKMLDQIMPPKQPRPYYGEGKMWAEADYGHEWIINLYLLDKHGQTLYGRPLHELIHDIDVQEVQKACVRDLFKEWAPKLHDSDWLNNSHYQSYLVLNLCRIFHAVVRADPQSKSISTAWVKETYPQWRDLIDSAQKWVYGAKMQKQAETLAFLKFVIEEVQKSRIYQEVTI